MLTWSLAPKLRIHCRVKECKPNSVKMGHAFELLISFGIPIHNCACVIRA